jgi:ketosteroid isomerase-like protein
VSTKPIDVLQTYLAAVESLKPEAALALFHEDAKVTTPLMPNAKPMLGRKSFEVAFKAVFSHFKHFQWVTKELHATDDPELAAGRTSATAVLADGRDYDNDYAIFMRVRGGKIVELFEYFSPIKAGMVSQSSHVKA